MTFYHPSKTVRRDKAGTPCPACGIKMHDTEVLGWVGEAGEIFLHPQCAAILVESQDNHLTTEG